MDTNDNVVLIQQPTPKDQVVAGVIALGLIAGSIAVGYAVTVAVDKLNEARIRRQNAKKAAQQTAE